MGDGRRATGDRWQVMVVVVIAVRVYNSFSTVFVMIRGNTKTYLQARGRNAPEPIVVVVIVVVVAAAAGSVAVAASSDPPWLWWAVIAGLLRG